MPRIDRSGRVQHRRPVRVRGRRGARSRSGRRGDDARTYAELDERATRLRRMTLGVRIGDHVGLYLRNSVAHVELMLACYKARAVPINVNYRYTDDELQYVADDADLVALCHDADARSATRLRGARSRSRYERWQRDFAIGPLGRRPLRALHGRHDRSAEGRRVAPGGHVLRRARRREPGRTADHRPPSHRGVGARQPRATPARVPAAGRSRAAAVRLARARSADARQRPVVGARHAARRRQGRAVRRAARRHGSRARRSSNASASASCNLVGDASARPLLDALDRRTGPLGHCRRCGCSARAAASCRAR